MNRQQVISRLELGRSAARELPRRDTGHRQFLFLNPIVDEARAIKVESPSDWGEIRRRAAVPNERVVTGFEVRVIALRPGWEEEPDDWDMYEEDAVSERFTTLADLEAALRSRWNVALEDLVPPHDVDHPF